MKLYHYPKCSSCRKAIKFLQQKNIDFQAVDISQSPPSLAELKLMLGSYSGDVRKLFNTSGLLYREKKLKDQLPIMKQGDALNLLVGEGMLVKRPFLLDQSGQTGIVGFKEQEWEEFC